jgi:hypothetical protein
VAGGDKLFVNDENLLGQGVTKEVRRGNAGFFDVSDFKHVSVYEKSQSSWHLDCLPVHRTRVTRGFPRVQSLEAADADGGHGGGRKALQQPE